MTFDFTTISILKSFINDLQDLCSVTSRLFHSLHCVWISLCIQSMLTKLTIVHVSHFIAELIFNIQSNQIARHFRKVDIHIDCEVIQGKGALNFKLASGSWPDIR